MSNLLNFLMLAGAFALLFGIAEVLYRMVHIPAEITRKIVHAGTGCLTLLFPILLHNTIEVGLLCGTFLLILLLSMRYHLLPSINAVHRKSWGSLLYPVIVFCVYVFYTHYAAIGHKLFHPLYYFFMPILVMAICDPVAALAGNAFRNKYPKTAPGKTFAGSFAFFFSAAILVVFLSAYFNHSMMPAQGYLVIGIMIAFMATLAERFGNRGWDNFTIPVSVALGMYIMESGLKIFAG